MALVGVITMSTKQILGTEPLGSGKFLIWFCLAGSGPSCILNTFSSYQVSVDPGISQAVGEIQSAPPPRVVAAAGHFGCSPILEPTLDINQVNRPQAFKFTGAFLPGCCLGVRPC